MVTTTSEARGVPSSRAPRANFFFKKREGKGVEASSEKTPHSVRLNGNSVCRTTHAQDGIDELGEQNPSIAPVEGPEQAPSLQSKGMPPPPPQFWACNLQQSCTEPSLSPPERFGLSSSLLLDWGPAS
eukprot:5916673-Amphidinium_carterae.1